MNVSPAELWELFGYLMMLFVVIGFGWGLIKYVNKEEEHDKKEV